MTYGASKITTREECGMTHYTHYMKFAQPNDQDLSEDTGVEGAAVVDLDADPGTENTDPS